MAYSVNCSILLTELPLLERPAAARAAGFDAIEFWWPFASSVPADGDVESFVASVRDAGVQLTGLNFAAGDMPGGDRGLVSWPARSAEFQDSIEIVVAIGQSLGCTAFNALYGNRVDDSTPAEQDAIALENLASAAEAIDRIGGIVLLEPVSGAPRYPLRRAADALTVIANLSAQSRVRNVKLLADFYHLAVNGDDVDAVIASSAAQFGHIQIADDPGRGAPGTGTLPLARWVKHSVQLGYRGPIGLEYTAPIETAFSWLARTTAAGAIAADASGLAS
jgi:hydroxypyruvate isomerase